MCTCGASANMIVIVTLPVISSLERQQTSSTHQPCLWYILIHRSNPSKRVKQQTVTRDFVCRAINKYSQCCKHDPRSLISRGTPHSLRQDWKEIHDAGADPGFFKRGGGVHLRSTSKKRGLGGLPILAPMLRSLHREPRGGGSGPPWIRPYNEEAHENILLLKERQFCLDGMNNIKGFTKAEQTELYGHITCGGLNIIY